MSSYTAADAFFEALWEAGVSHCFVNLGSDHPALMEAIVKGQKERSEQFPRIITCPSELVALSMADGFARQSGKPQCVIVHVDVGTSAMGAAIHNASCGRAPILIFAGLSPLTAEGELRGTRSEYIHWIQDVHDQKQIVAQYCRYTTEIRTGKNIKQVINRALQFATSDPAGPVYLTAAREILEETIQPYQLRQHLWVPAKLGVLSEEAVASIGDALVKADSPLIITGYLGRNFSAVTSLVKLADTVKGLRVLDTGGSHMNFPFSHPASVGMRYGVEPIINEADFLLIIDCDVPFIPIRCKPRRDARVIQIDLDPLKQQMPLHHLEVEERYRVDSAEALNQLQSYISDHPVHSKDISSPKFLDRAIALRRAHDIRLKTYDAQAAPPSDNSLSTPYIASKLRMSCPSDTIWVVEAVTQTYAVADQLRAELPGSWYNCGGAGLGWSGGGAIGIKLATDYQAGDRRDGRFVCQIVGDGTFLFSAPSSAAWIAQRYKIPHLTIILNNKGWNAPRVTMLAVHPNGHGSRVSNNDLHISFDPSPHYAEIARAASAGKLWTATATSVDEYSKLLPDAITSVKNGIGAVLEVQLANTQGASPSSKTPKL